MSSNPVVILPGIGQSKLIVVDDAGNKVKNAWPFELDEKALIGELKGSLVKMLLFKKDGGFSDRVAGIADDLTDPLSVKDDGTKKYRIKPVSFPKSVAECTPQEKSFFYKMFPLEELGEKMGEENLFYFAYDPFGDLEDTADSLDAFLSFVKEKTGCAKVNLISISVGGVVLKAYLRRFGDKGDTEKILNIVSALDGTPLVADLFENKLKLDDPASLLTSLGGRAASLASSIGMLPADIVKNTIEKSWNVIRRNLLDSCTTMWGLIPNNRFDAVFDAQLGKNADSPLAEKVRSFHEYSEHFAEQVKEKKFYQICGYARELFPVAESAQTCSDGVVDTASASFGAQCPTVTGQPQTASCVFPETTWFFSSQKHSEIAYNDVALKLVVKIMTGEIESVQTSADFPQFNGSRNIKQLKYTLIPNAEAALAEAEGAEKERLEDCIAEYRRILSCTVITGDADVKALENKLTEVLQSVKG